MGSSMNVFELEKNDVKKMLPVRKAESNKGTYGKTLIIAGQKGMAGACFFAGKAAYLTGCGLVRIVTAEENREIIQIKLPEAVILSSDSIALTKAINDADSILIGPGIGTGDEALGLLQKVFYYAKVPIIVDADGINILSKHMELLSELKTDVVLTPHLGEMSRLIKKPVSDIIGHEIEIANQFTERYNIILVMKSHKTLIARNGKNIFRNTTGDSSLSKGGTGDCLAGFIAGFTAESHDAYTASLIGPYIHGLAGTLAGQTLTQYSVLASDVLDFIPVAMKEIIT